MEGAAGEVQRVEGGRAVARGSDKWRDGGGGRGAGGGLGVAGGGWGLPGRGGIINYSWKVAFSLFQLGGGGTSEGL